MSLLGEVVVGLVILAGLAGIVIPVLPGLLLVTGAVVVWAAMGGGALGWGVGAAAVVLGGMGTVVKYLVPGRRLKDAGIPTSTLLLACALAVGGFFVIPVVGAILGFVGGVYLAERNRVGATLAWPQTRLSLRAVALAIGIELTAGLLIAAIWLAAVILG